MKCTATNARDVHVTLGQKLLMSFGGLWCVDSPRYIRHWPRSHSISEQINIELKSKKKKCKMVNPGSLFVCLSQSQLATPIYICAQKRMMLGRRRDKKKTNAQRPPSNDQLWSTDLRRPVKLFHRPSNGCSILRAVLLAATIARVSLCAQRAVLLLFDWICAQHSAGYIYSEAERPR